MKFLLLTLTSFMTLSTVFNWDPGPAPGVKIKNAILYLLCVSLFMQIAREGRVKVQLPAIQAVLLLQIAYATLTFIAIVTVIHYPHYKVLDNALLLKGLIDQTLFFIVFFYGIRNEKDAIFVLNFLIACWALSHVIAVLDASGIVHIGDLEQRRDGRVNGAVGESNQYGAFVAMTLPAMVAAAVMSRGVRRLFWTAASMMTAITLLLTASRGALVAIFMAGVGGAMLFKRYVPARRLVMWGIGAVAMIVFALLMVNVLGYGHLLYSRFVGETNTGDMSGTSSGRLDFWRHALRVMAEQPITFLTGYGWRAYWTMPFRYSPHNFYINFWFNLGLIGVGSGIYLLAAPVRIARQALDRASAQGRIVLIGFCVATIALATAVFFVDIVLPWLYYFAYAGIAMRIAVNATEASAAAPALNAPPAQIHPRNDRFGWAAATRRLQSPPLR